MWVGVSVRCFRVLITSGLHGFILWIEGAGVVVSDGLR